MNNFEQLTFRELCALAGVNYTTALLLGLTRAEITNQIKLTA
jgi:hypothetical protein